MPTSPRATVVMRSLKAMSYDIPIVMTLAGGRKTPPAKIVERLSGQDEREGTTVAVRMEGGEVYHLGDVFSIVRAA